MCPLWQASVPIPHPHRVIIINRWAHSHCKEAIAISCRFLSFTDKWPRGIFRAKFDRFNYWSAINYKLLYPTPDIRTDPLYLARGSLSAGNEYCVPIAPHAKGYTSLDIWSDERETPVRNPAILGHQQRRRKSIYRRRRVSLIIVLWIKSGRRDHEGWDPSKTTTHKLQHALWTTTVLLRGHMIHSSIDSGGHTFARLDTEMAVELFGRTNPISTAASFHGLMPRHPGLLRQRVLPHVYEYDGQSFVKMGVFPFAITHRRGFAMVPVRYGFANLSGRLVGKTKVY